MKRNMARVLTIIVLAIVPIWMLITVDVVFSDKENRNMAKFPEVSLKSISDGSFMSGFETYMADQFPLRNLCISIKTAALRATGKKKINDVYLAGDDYLIATEAVYDDERTDKLLEAVNGFSGRMENVSVNFMLAPNSSYVYDDYLPYGVKSTQGGSISKIKSGLDGSINFIDPSASLIEKREEGLYYRTDHHWRTKAAYYAFLDYAKTNNISPVEYEFYDVTGTFQGTQASNSGVYKTYDAVSIAVPKDSVGTYVVNYVNENITKTSLFDESRLKEKDKYQVFFGGNYAEVDISTTANTGRNLMIIKDSFANCFIPLLTPYYDKIIVIDPRYFYDDIYLIAEINNINEVLFLYNVNSFLEDNSLTDILAVKKNN